MLFGDTEAVVHRVATCIGVNAGVPPEGVGELIAMVGA